MSDKPTLADLRAEWERTNEPGHVADDDDLDAAAALIAALDARIAAQRDALRQARAALAAVGWDHRNAAENDVCPWRCMRDADRWSDQVAHAPRCPQAKTLAIDAALGGGS
jgi:hypothetical protein